MPASVTDFGAVGDGSAIVTRSLQRAIDTVADGGGGTVIVPAGRFVTGSLRLRSNINLHLEPGATIVGASDVAAFPKWAPNWDGIEMHASLITGEGLDNVSISGRGTIDGNGAFWWDLFRRKQLGRDNCDKRPRLIRLIDCRNVLVESVTLQNSPMWTLNPVACDEVTIRGIIVRNPPDSPNTDGINPDSCRNVHISDCHIDVGDDCVTIKSGSEEEPRKQLRPCENITITNCTMIHGHGGVVIGSEMSGGVRNIAISNCTFVGTDRGIRIKSRRGRGGAVEDIRVSNIVMDGVLCPIVVNLFYGCGAWGQSKVTETAPQPVTEATPRFRRLRFSNISARQVKYAAGYVLGLPEMAVEDVAFSDVSIYLDPDNAEAGQPAMAPVAENLCRAGLVLQNVRSVQLSNVQVFDQLGPPLILKNAVDVQSRNGSPQPSDQSRNETDLPS